MAKRPFNGSPTVDGYYTTFDSSEVHRIEESSDDQGGGSSDFSTAELTIVNNTGNSTSFDGCIIKDDRLQVNANLNEGINVLTVVLYEGLLCCGTYDTDMSTAVITGNAEYSSEDDCYIVTGDCTITLS